MRSAFRLIIITNIVALTCPLTLSAYIDPGTGSYILQLLIAAFLGISLSLKIFWKKIKRLFSSKKIDEQNLTDGK